MQDHSECILLKFNLTEILMLFFNLFLTHPEWSETLPSYNTYFSFLSYRLSSLLTKENKNQQSVENSLIFKEFVSEQTDFVILMVIHLWNQKSDPEGESKV